MKRRSVIYAKVLWNLINRFAFSMLLILFALLVPHDPIASTIGSKLYLVSPEELNGYIKILDAD